MSRRRLSITTLLVASGLLFAQVLFACHEIEHLGHIDKDFCEVCLTGAALGSPLISSSPAPPPRPVSSPIERAPRHEQARGIFHRTYRARAPPTSDSALSRIA